MKTILVTGFGAFPGVADNPSARLARAVNGQHRGALRFVGEVLPVSYRRAPLQTLRLVDAHKPDMVLGTGVAGHTTAPRVERRATWVAESRVDVEGQTLTLLAGPPVVNATWPADELAATLGVETSDDAGHYVCNAWLYTVAQRASVPVAFVHMPPEGMAADQLIDALGAALA